MNPAVRTVEANQGFLAAFAEPAGGPVRESVVPATLGKQTVMSKVIGPNRSATSAQPRLRFFLSTT